MEKFKLSVVRLFKSPYTLSDLHILFTIFWIAIIPPTLMWWSNSVTWVLLISIWANIVSHAGAASAARGADRIESVVIAEETKIINGDEKK